MAGAGKRTPPHRTAPLHTTPHYTAAWLDDIIRLIGGDDVCCVAALHACAALNADIPDFFFTDRWNLANSRAVLIADICTCFFAFYRQDVAVCCCATIVL